MNPPPRFALFGVALLAATLGACTHASGSDPAEHPGSSAPELVAEAEPTASPQPIEAPQLSPEQAFLAVYAALRDGDWPAFERFAGADPIRYIRAGSLGDDPPEQQMIAANQAQQWLAEIQRSWAPSCMDNPDPPCRGFNPLSLGVDDPAELELRCAEPGPNEPGVVCCRHQPALLHNTPFLVDVCFDEGQRVTQVSVLDG